MQRNGHGAPDARNEFGYCIAALRGMEPNPRSSHWPLFLLTGVASLINILIPLVLVRILSPEEVGRYKIFFLYVMVMPWLMLTKGIYNGLAYWAGVAEDPMRLFRASWTLLVLIAVVMLVPGMLLREQFAAVMSWSGGQALVFVVAAILGILSTFYEETCVARGLATQGGAFAAIFEAIRALVMLSVALVLRDLMAVFITHVILSVLKLVSSWLVDRSGGLDQSVVRVYWNGSVFSRIARYSFPISLGAALMIVAIYSDQLILSKVLAPGEFAIYALGCLNLPPLLMFEQAVNRVLIPKLSFAFSNHRNEEANVAFREAVRELGWVLVPATAGLVVFSEAIVGLLYPAQYSAAAGYLRIFALSYLCYVIPYDAVPRALGKSAWYLKTAAIFSILSVVVLGLLTGYFGARGALCGVLGSQFALRFYGLMAIRSHVRWRLSKAIPATSLTIFAGIAGFLGIASLALRPLFTSRIIWFVACGLGFAAAYFAMTLPLRGKMKIARKATASTGGKVLMLTQYVNVGGLERLILNLCIGLKKRGIWSPSVWAYDEIQNSATLAGEFRQAGVPLSLNVKGRGFSMRTVRRVADTIREQQIDVVHTHNLGALIYGALAKAMCGGNVRLSHTQHSFVHLDKNWKNGIYERIFARFADDLCVVSSPLKSIYASVGLNMGRIKIVPNGIVSADPPGSRRERLCRRSEVLAAISDFGARCKISQYPDAVWILCLARVHPGKGQRQVLEIWNAMSDAARNQSILVFVGPETTSGSVELLQQEIADAKAPERIVYVGATSVPLLWMQASDIYVSGSECEGMPLAPVEAALSGLPVLLSRIDGHRCYGGFTEQYELNQPSRGAEIFNGWIREITHNSDAFYASILRNVAPYRERFDVERMVDAYQQIYSGEGEVGGKA